MQKRQRAMEERAIDIQLNYCTVGDAWRLATLLAASRRRPEGRVQMIDNASLIAVVVLL